MCSTSRSIVKRTGFRAEVFPLRCRSWSCPQCAPRRRKALIRQAVDGEPNRFITITSNASTGATPDEWALLLTRAWRDVVREFRRLWPQREAQYMCVFEATKRGYPHMHILWRGGFMPWAWLSKQMRERISAPHVYITKMDNPSKAAYYCAKYFSKRPIRFGNTKRYWRSFKYLAESETARKKRRNAGSWFYQIDESWQATLRYFAVNGAIVRNLKGEGGVAIWLPDEASDPPQSTGEATGRVYDNPSAIEVIEAGQGRLAG